MVAEDLNTIAWLIGQLEDRGVTPETLATVCRDEEALDKIACVMQDAIEATLVSNASMSSTDMNYALRDDSIDRLDLPIRPYNVLRRNGITRIGQLIDMSADSLMNKYRGMGQTCLDQIQAALHSFGLSLAE